ncbi:MAG: hypothetical protein KIC54_05455 [Clostridium sp.]|nr:hypothetical protein [Clostridium sp.]
MIVKEKDLSKIIKDNFHLRTLLLELEGMIEGHISFIKAICIYSHKKILNILELLHNIRIDIASQYKIIYREKEKILEIKLDNGQNVKLTVIR